MALLSAVGQLLDPRAAGFLRPVLPAAPVTLAFVKWYLWAALTPFIFWLSRRYGIERGHWGRRIALLLGVGAVVAVGVSTFLTYLLFEVFFEARDPNFRFEPLFGIKRLFWLSDLVVYFAVLAAGFARDYFLRLRARHHEAVALEAEAARLEAERAHLEAQLAEARLMALRAQLDPHFLFNTLNAMSSLVGSDPRGVRRMITRLGVLLRHTLEESADAEVPLAREVEVLAQYVEIMEIRFEGRLTVETHVAPDALDALVPTLILQPLVENAIKHGVDRLPTDRVGHIAVSARREADALVITVRDNGPAVDLPDVPREPGRGGGVGLRNTRARLAQLYGTEHGFTLAAAAGGGVEATLTLPYHTRADLHAAAVDRGTAPGAVADAGVAAVAAVRG